MKHECNCSCRHFVLIFLSSGKPFIAIRGEQSVSEIKKLLGISEHDALYQVAEHGCPIEYKDGATVQLKGCETFYGCPPAGGNSKEEAEKELLDEPFENTFGVKRTLHREAGGLVLVLEQFHFSDELKVDIALEWPKQNRLLFSAKIPTPKHPDANWCPTYANIRIAGRSWQGVSLQTKETNPLKVLLSYLRCLGLI